MDNNQRVVFFGPQGDTSESPRTRASIDIRVRSAHASTNIRPGCHRPLHRGVVRSCVAEWERKRNELPAQ